MCSRYCQETKTQNAALQHAHSGSGAQYWYRKNTGKAASEHTRIHLDWSGANHDHDGVASGELDCAVVLLAWTETARPKCANLKVQSDTGTEWWYPAMALQPAIRKHGAHSLY